LPESFIEIGAVVRPWGVHGDFLVKTFADASRHLRLKRVFIEGVERHIERSRQHSGGLMLKLRGIDTPEDAAKLRGATLELPESQFAAPPRDTYYHFQLLGLRVRTTSGQDVGILEEILENPANDVYVVRGPKGEVLVPAIGDVVKEVDVQQGVVTIEAIPGLLEES
jgi:16S rRNA processing protein RimM